MDRKKRLVIVDGHQLVWRCVGASPLEEPRKLAGEILRWTSVIPRYHHTSTTVFTWDVGTSFRKKLFPGYKAKRRKDEKLEAMRETVRDAMKIVVPIIEALGIRQCYLKGYEADDVINSIVVRERRDGEEMIVYSHDADLLQLIRFDGVFCLHPTGKPLGRNYVKNKHGVEPEMIQTLKALAGDSSDNYGGVRGIGPVNAVKLINEHGDLFKILEALEAGKIKKGLAKKIESDRENALLAWKLAALRLVNYKSRQTPADRQNAIKTIIESRVKAALEPEVFESLIEEG